jgi:asparaginyl-tRNA synthetase
MLFKGVMPDMTRIQIADLYSFPEKYADREINVSGWCRSVRASNAFGFIVLNDGSSFNSLQLVIEKDAVDNYNEIAAQNTGASIAVCGTFCLTPEARQPFELKAAKVSVLGSSSPDYPLQNKKHSMEFLRSIAHLRPRTNTFNAVFRVRSQAAFAIHKFFNERGFVYVHTPVITASDCEGAGEMFRVTTLDPDNPPRSADGKIDFARDFFGKTANLTVSGQLNAECFALAFGSVYTFGPTFRAENSNTPRHAAEFWMVEPEIAFADLSDDMDLAEDMLKFIIRYLLETCPSELEFFNKFVDSILLSRLNNIINSSFARITYTEAIKLISEGGKTFDYPLTWGMDLQTEHERYLTELHGCPVFVTDWPREIKAFYMRLNDDKKTVAAMDLLVPGVGELVGGSQREERTDILLDSLARLNLNEEDYRWYIELRKYGGTKHAGFGLGFERLVMYVTGITNIRDVAAFPRTTGSAEF